MAGGETVAANDVFQAWKQETRLKSDLFSLLVVCTLVSSYSQPSAEAGLFLVVRGHRRRLFQYGEMRGCGGESLGERECLHVMSLSSAARVSSLLISTITSFFMEIQQNRSPGSPLYFLTRTNLQTFSLKC